MSSRSSGRSNATRAVSAGLILLLSGGLILGSTGGASAAPLIRKEINSLTTTEIDNYRKGVALMKSRAYNDPTSWLYQANMHGYPVSNTFPATVCPVVGTPQPLWSTCQHGSFFFLAWHRMYLYYFERILRSAVRTAIGNPTYNFTLPFWNYKNFHTLPTPFRVPNNTTNSLWVAQRTSNCNNGSTCVSASTASDTAAMGLFPFCSCSGSSCSGCTTGISSDESFGGGFISAPNHSASFPGELEIQPHGAVHNAVGGPTGWMSYFECAARDPIFWLHHANIDRLWQVWLNQLGGRKNPIANGTWAKQKFTFYDETKHQVVLTGCQIVNMATQLNYQYAGVPVTNAPLCPTTSLSVEKPIAVTPLKRLTTTEAATRLSNAQAKVKVSLPTGAAAPKRLAVEGIEVITPGAVYQVYLNLPEGQKPDPAGPNFLGNISIFASPGHSGEVTRTFDISGKGKLLAGKEAQLTFVREQLDQSAAASNKEFLRFKRVVLLGK
jgi:tyrosinase